MVHIVSAQHCSLKAKQQPYVVRGIVGIFFREKAEVFVD